MNEQILKQIQDFPDDPLPFPTRQTKVQGGVVLEYIIPDEYKTAVLEALCPFKPVPKMNSRKTDIHEDKKFYVREFRVVREGNFNMIVSPYYHLSGGSIIDWM